MTNNESEVWIDKILVYMQEFLEKEGISSLNNAIFFFDTTTCQELKLTLEQVHIAIKKCISRKLMEEQIFTREKHYLLTENGQARALSCMLASKRDDTNSNSIIVNGNNANIQVGNNNVQNISNVFKFLIEQIENSSTSDEEKNCAKNYLKKFIEHPLVNTILGTAGSALANLR